MSLTREVRVAVAVAAVYGAYVVARLLAVGELLGFAQGYDGLAYYRLALDPLTHELSAEGITFTRPAYWQTRIGYPVLVWAVSGGQSAVVPLALVLVNVAAVAVIAWLGARLARQIGRTAWWGAVPAMWAGFLVGVGQDLTEPVAGALLMAAVLAIRAGRAWPAALALTAAGLTRETTLVLAVAVLAVGLLRSFSGAQRRTPWWVGAIPLGVYVGWRTWVRDRWSGMVPASADAADDNVLQLPLTALGHYFAHAGAHLGSQWPNLLLLAPTLVVIAIAAVALRESDAAAPVRLALLAHLVVLLCLPVWDRGQAYLRWGCEPVLLAWVLLLGSRSRALPALAAVSAPLWALTATQSLGYPNWNGVWAW